ncbi:MAG: hypothetical protein SFY80_17460 [Verrucomicrobiota bacterium]|nr:hypothetical protein [Verrucomicrobiota bacterium]
MPVIAQLLPYLPYGLSPFFVGAGLVLGLVFSVPLVSGVVWCVQLTLGRGMRQGLAAGTGIALAQGFWAGLAAVAIFLLAQFSDKADWVFRFGAAGILTAMGFAVVQSRKITTLTYDGPLEHSWPIFKTSFAVAATMPMRLLGYMALMISCSLHLRPHALLNAFLVAGGVVVGSWAWWFYFVLLAYFFGKRVPEDITLRSMNRLRLLSLAVFTGLFLICTTPLLFPGM